MHYENNHSFILGEIKKVWNSKYTIDVPGMPGHFLYSNGDISHSFDKSLSYQGFDLFYNSFESAKDAINAYEAKAKKEELHHHNETTHKLSEPQLALEHHELYEVVSVTNPNLALSSNNTIIHHAYRALFDKYQKALFAKLYYERTHK